jgi:DNA-binding NarL/FixJ family response regulator
VPVTILIVEDEVSLRLALEDQIQADSTEYQIVAIGGSQEEIDDCLKDDEKGPDLAIIDLNLPNPDGKADHDRGFKIVEDLFRRVNRFPVIVITVRNDLAAVRRAQELGLASFIVKPWSKKVLLEQIKRCLNTREAGPDDLQIFGEVKE